MLANIICTILATVMVVGFTIDMANVMNGGYTVRDKAWMVWVPIVFFALTMWAAIAWAPHWFVVFYAVACALAALLVAYDVLRSHRLV